MVGDVRSVAGMKSEVRCDVVYGGMLSSYTQQQMLSGYRGSKQDGMIRKSRQTKGRQLLFYVHRRTRAAPWRKEDGVGKAALRHEALLSQNPKPWV